MAAKIAIGTARNSAYIVPFESPEGQRQQPQFRLYRRSGGRLPDIGWLIVPFVPDLAEECPASLPDRVLYLIERQLSGSIQGNHPIAFGRKGHGTNRKLAVGHSQQRLRRGRMVKEHIPFVSPVTKPLTR